MSLVATRMGNVAYDYEKSYNRNYANNYRGSYVAGSEAPATRPAPQKQPGQVPRPKVVRKTKKQLRAETRRARAKAIQILAFATVFFSVMVFQIYSQVRVDELDREISAVNASINVVESENTRLNMDLDANVSLDKVEEYAQDVLGMVKVEDYQVNYVNLSEGDTVEVSGGKIHTSFWEKLKSIF